MQLQQRGIPLMWEGAVNQECISFSSEDERLKINCMTLWLVCVVSFDFAVTK